MHTAETIAAEIGRTIMEHRLLINFTSNNIDALLDGKHPADGIGIGLMTILKCMDQLCGSLPVSQQGMAREGCLLFCLQWLSNADKARTLKPGAVN